MNDNLTLEQARKLIVSLISPVATEKIPLAQAVDRVCGQDYYAPYGLPEYSQSLYDGYALSFPKATEKEPCILYQIRGEIAAGDTREQTITPGNACRIMTGALVPRGTWKIVPQERCVERDGGVMVEKDFAAGTGTNIRAKGSRLRKGSTLVRRGVRIAPLHLARLADFGVDEVEAHCRPTVHFFCTGSELVDRSANKEVGKKFSSNRFQLAGLIQQAGSSWVDRGSVDDQRKLLEDKLAGIVGDSPTVIISTGGMGPGKYDLLEEIFTSVGGQTIFSSLRLRPGKSTLFGMLGDSLYFGLPGPPPAVHALFHALVRPALMAAGGMKKWRPLTVRARLERDISIARADTLRLHEGVLFQQQETCSVRLPSQKEMPNCYIYCPAGRKNFRRGSTIGVVPFSA